MISLLVAVSAAGAAKPQAPGPRAPASVLSSSSGSVVFRVDLDPWTVSASPALEGTDRLTVPRFIRRGNPGEPSRPARKFLVGLPAEGAWTLSWRVLESAPLGQRRLLEPVPYPQARPDPDLGVIATQRYEIDPAVYDRFRGPPVVSADDAAWIRRQRVLPVWVEPLTYDPATGQGVLATSIEVTVTFRGGVDGGEGDAGRQPPRPAAEKDEWEHVFSRLLVNAGQAREWRRPSTVRPQMLQRAEALTPTGTLVRIMVKNTGIHRVTADALVAAGYPPNQPITSLHLFKRGYDDDTFSETVTNVAYAIDEHPSGTQDVFEGQDAIVFYAIRLGEDVAQEDPEENLSDHNVYWLGTTSGPVMADRTLQPGFLSDDTANAWFSITRRFADDTWFREETPEGISDFYYHNPAYLLAVDFPFEMEAVRPSSSVSLLAELHGAFRGETRSMEVRLDNAQANVVLNPDLRVDNTSVVDFQSNIPAAAFVAGLNTFHFHRVDKNDKTQVQLNWLEVSYQALYRARGDMLAFDTASLTGDTSITVTGLGSDTGQLWLFDVSDPFAPVKCLLSSGLFADYGGSIALTFRDAIASKKQYILVPEGRMIDVPAGDIALDAASAIIGDPAEAGVDVLVVSHKDFLDGLQGWLRYRRAQGYRMLAVDVEDVFDEFNGGVPSPRGIDRFVRHFFELGNASYVVLVGDGSEDHKQVHADSGPDFIPSHSRSEYVYAPFNRDEVVTLDKEFVKLPGPGGVVDDYPDLVIGRIPVGEATELQKVLNKLYRYERPQMTDTWRRRMIVLADDAWSGDPWNSCYSSAERGFEIGQEMSAAVMESAYPNGFDVVRFYMSDYTEPFHPENPRNGYCEQIMYDLRIYTRNEVTPLFMNELKQGATLVTMQAHMNRSLVTHEMVFTTLGGGVPGSGGTKDHLRIGNRDKPFVILGMGCHFSDYALHREFEATRLASNPPNGDAFAEQLLFQNREAAVGTYGSSGFEYLGQVNNFMNLFTSVWFYNAPYESIVETTEGHWIFGQLMYLVEAEAVGIGQDKPVDRYHILGDPLLRIDAGPPLVEATVNGDSVQSGYTVGATVDTIAVVARVADENVIEAFELWVDGEDRKGTLDITKIGDDNIPLSRTYEVRFTHLRQINEYDIVLRALQAADTTKGEFHIAAEFVIHVPSKAGLTLTVNGQPKSDGDTVPGRGDYRIELGLPDYISSSEIAITIDNEDVADQTFSHPSPTDTTTWIIEFSKILGDGWHELVVTVGTAQIDAIRLLVSSTVGLRSVINYPNPFTDGTHFVYYNDVEIENGTIDVFTVSGKKIIRLDIPPNSRGPGQNSVYWSGRDAVGDEIANGVYLYVIRVTQRGQDTTIHGKSARMK